MYCCREDFTEYTNDIGNTSPNAFNNKKCVFATVSAMDGDQNMGRNSMLFGQAKGLFHTESTWTLCQNTNSLWKDCNFVKHGHMQLSSTTHCLLFERTVCMKTKETLYHKVY